MKPAKTASSPARPSPPCLPHLSSFTLSPAAYSLHLPSFTLSPLAPKHTPASGLCAGCSLREPLGSFPHLLQIFVYLGIAPVLREFPHSRGAKSAHRWWESGGLSFLATTQSPCSGAQGLGGWWQRPRVRVWLLGWPGLELREGPLASVSLPLLSPLPCVLPSPTPSPADRGPGPV